MHINKIELTLIFQVLNYALFTYYKCYEQLRNIKFKCLYNLPYEITSSTEEKSTNSAFNEL